MVPLIADRFLSITPTLVRDLATNGVARFRLERASGDPVAWSDRCTALSAVWHPSLAECLDAGALGPAHTFEAYAVGPPRRRGNPRPHEQLATRQAVSAFLRACGIRPGAMASDVVDACGRALVLPGPFVSDDANADVRDRGVTWLGLRLVPRPTLQAIVERLSQAARPGTSVVEIEALPHSGGRLLLRQCAREGRRLGWVPVAAESLVWNGGRAADERAALDDALAARHVLVLHDARTPRVTREVLAGLLLHLGRRSRLPRLLITLVGRRPPAGALVLSPVDESELRDALVSNSARLRVRAARAARTCRGLPGLFVHALLNEAAVPRIGPASRGRGYRVHEGRAAYDVDAGAVSNGHLPEMPVATPPLAGAVARTLEAAAALAAKGRSAAGVRMLRREHGALSRRGRHADAAHLALASGRLLWRSGQVHAALALFEQAVNADEGSPSIAALLAAGWLGRCRLEFLDPEAGESVLRSAWTAALLAAEHAAATWVGAQLARTLWWQGRFDDARELTRKLPWPDATEMEGPRSRSPACPDDDAAHAVVCWWAEAARAALACGDQAGVVAALTAARACAAPGANGGRGELLLARAWWEAVVGDREALRQTVREGLLSARAAHDRMLALELRLVALDGSLRGRDGALARRLAARLRRISEGAVPPLLAARVQIALAIADARPSAGVRSRLADQGLGACAPGGAGVLADWPMWSAPRSPAMVDELIEVVRVCQEEEDASRALERLAATLASRLQAAGTVVLVGGRRPASIARPGSNRVPLETARRAADCGLPLDPQPVDGGLEAAAPVRYGGTVIGAVACRWVHGAVVDAARVRGLLSAAAASAAPCVEAVGRTLEPPGLPQVEAELLGVSDAMQQVRRAVARAADAPFPVLVSAESGCGKELVARALHRASARRTRAFCALNCAALPDELLEAELFGHTRGAFTGAAMERRGLFEEADGGVLFLDEIGELSPRGQAKLLRVLQEGEVRRLGETMARRVDVRVVAATNRVLDREVQAGRFRRDLFYRLDVIRIVVPPLRERVEDIPLLASAFWRTAAARVGTRAVLGDSVVGLLARHDWPGNVRELQNVVAALAVNAPRRGTVSAHVLGTVLSQVPLTPAPVTLEEARRHFEARFVRAALARAGGHRGRAAVELGLTRQGLTKLMERLGVRDPRIPVEAPVGGMAASGS